MACSDDCPSTPCGVCGGNSSTCGCSSGCATGGLTPYYNQAKGCQEEHITQVVQNKYEANICTGESFNIPACDEAVVVVVPDLFKITVDTYFWHPTYGYLKVIGFDVASCTVTLENECQDGNAAPGTAVPACTCFIVVDDPNGADNPCTNAAVVQGSLVVCHDGVMQPLDASAAGQVPVSVDADTNEVEFRTIDLPTLDCTTLTADVTLIPGNAGPYTLNVDDSSIFVAGDIIQFAGLTHRLVVNTVPSGIQLTATIVTAIPIAFEVISAGTEVCMSSCCEQLDYRITNDEYTLTHPCTWDLSDWIYHYIDYQNSGNRRHDYVVDIGDGGVSNDIILDKTISNNTCKIMRCIINLNFEVNGGFECDVGDYGNINMLPNFGYVTGVGPLGAPPLLSITNIFRHEAFHLAGLIIDDTVVRNTYEYSTTYMILVPAGQQLRFRAGLFFELYAGTAGVKYEIDHMVSIYNLHALAIN